MIVNDGAPYLYWRTPSLLATIGNSTGEILNGNPWRQLISLRWRSPFKWWQRGAMRRLRSLMKAIDVNGAIATIISIVDSDSTVTNMASIIRHHWNPSSPFKWEQCPIVANNLTMVMSCGIVDNFCIVNGSPLTTKNATNYQSPSKTKISPIDRYWRKMTLLVRITIRYVHFTN